MNALSIQSRRILTYSRDKLINRVTDMLLDIYKVNSHGHENFPVNTVGWHFHHLDHDELVHCEGGAKNPYKIIHIKKKHGINKEYARGHGINTEPTWFHFEDEINKTQFDLLSGEIIEVADVPDGFKLFDFTRLSSITDRLLDIMPRYKRKGIADIFEISDELHKELWFKFIDSSDPLVKGFDEDLSPLFVNQGKEVLRNIQRHPPPSGKSMIIRKQTVEEFTAIWTFDDQKWVGEFAVTGEFHIESGTIAGANNALDALDNPVVFNPANVAVQSFIKDRTFNFSFDVNETTAKILSKQFAAGLDAGESVKDISKRVQGVFEFSEKHRATRIAQTETIGAVNKGALEGNRQSGVVWGTQWLAALDDKVRDDHSSEHGNSVKLDDTFPITGLEYPGDQSVGDLSNIVNCRCTTKPLTRNPNA
ncbi:hypothetical protein LCGC14_0758210 [marine sediment metagenome]|uniref:Phage head morphogenesis domain-containing protein n=1 Tax=marine sediment metagenome TaxID=412755 RepID=A0A0F9Q653_9ZZZZ